MPLLKQGYYDFSFSLSNIFFLAKVICVVYFYGLECYYKRACSKYKINIELLNILLKLYLLEDLANNHSTQRDNRTVEDQ